MLTIKIDEGKVRTLGADCQKIRTEYWNEDDYIGHIENPTLPMYKPFAVLYNYPILNYLY